MSNHEPAEKNELATAKGEVLVYQTDDGQVKVDVRLEDETVWLAQQQMAELFQTTQQNISLHIRNHARGNSQEILVSSQGKGVGMSSVIWTTTIKLLEYAGSVSHEEAFQKAHVEYEKFRVQQLAEPTEAEKAAGRIASGADNGR